MIGSINQKRPLVKALRCMDVIQFIRETPAQASSTKMKLHRIDLQTHPNILLVICLYFTGGFQTKICVNDSTHPRLSLYVHCVYRLLDFARRSHVTVKIMHREYFRSIVAVYGEQSKCSPQTCSLRFLLNWIICQFGRISSLQQLTRSTVVTHGMVGYARLYLPPILSDIFFVRYTLTRHIQQSPRIQRTISLGLFTERGNGQRMLLSAPNSQRLRDYLHEYFSEMYCNEAEVAECLSGLFYKCEHSHSKLNTLGLHFIVSARMNTNIWMNANSGIIRTPLRLFMDN